MLKEAWINVSFKFPAKFPEYTITLNGNRQSFTWKQDVTKYWMFVTNIYLYMLQFIIATVLLAGVCFGERLENTYLPPASSYSAGGSGNFLLAPKPSFGGSSFGGRSAFGASGGFSQGSSHPIPATSYGVPAVQTSYNSFNTRAGPQIPILKLNSDNNGFGSYHYEWVQRWWRKKSSYRLHNIMLTEICICKWRSVLSLQAFTCNS